MLTLHETYHPSVTTKPPNDKLRCGTWTRLISAAYQRLWALNWPTSWLSTIIIIPIDIQHNAKKSVTNSFPKSLFGIVCISERFNVLIQSKEPAHVPLLYSASVK